MPGFDGTGPTGNGPLTGRRMGNCASVAPAGRGRGYWGRGAGRGYGVGARFQQAPAISADERYTKLENRIAELQDELTTLRQQHENSDNQR